MYKNITKATTEDSLWEKAKAARVSLAELVAESQTSEYLLGDRLVQYAQNVKTSEAVANAQHTYLKMVQRDATEVELLRYLLSLVGRGPDDTWSGRGNDSNRSAFDGVRSWASDQSDHLRYGDQSGTE